MLHAPRRDYNGEHDPREKADRAPGIVGIRWGIASPSLRGNPARNLNHIARQHREQAAIVDGVARDLNGVQKALAQADREIALMQEYRTRLVSDVVTGHLDVRAAAASLPDIEPATVPTEVEGDEGTDIEDGEAA